MSLRICQGISVYFIVTCFSGSLGSEYNQDLQCALLQAFAMIYKTPQILSVLNHEALKDASKHWLMFKKKKKNLPFPETPRFIGSINKSTAQLRQAPVKGLCTRNLTTA